MMDFGFFCFEFSRNGKNKFLQNINGANFYHVILPEL